MAPTRRYAGAWGRKATRPATQVPIRAAIDPEHLTPTANPEWVNTPPGWVSTVVAPDLPGDLMPGDRTIGAVPGGPIDGDPLDPMDGTGVGPGLTLEQSQALRGVLHSQDRGTIAARTYQPTTDRYDGTGPHSTIIEDTPGHGDSPETLVYQRSGVGAETDPHARIGKRQKRWWERVIDRHMWGPEYRPLVLKQATTSREMPAVADPTQNDSPWVANGPQVATDDRLVAPEVRRTPRPWDEAMTTDGGTPAMAGYGLTTWGL